MLPDSHPGWMFYDRLTTPLRQNHLPYLRHAICKMKQLAADDMLLVCFLSVLVVISVLRGRTWNKPEPEHHQWYERRQETILGRKHQSQKEERDLALRLNATKHDVAILWGSQSGRAEGLAHLLARNMRQRLHLQPLLLALDDFDAQSLARVQEATPVIFLLATYAEGDPTDNAVSFCKWLSSTAEDLSHLRYATFGLGNSMYKQYNRVVETVSSSLEERGAKALVSCGRGDDADGSTESDFLEWEQGTFRMLEKEFDCRETESAWEASVIVTKDEGSTDRIHTGKPITSASRGPQFMSVSGCIPLTMKSSHNLTPNFDRRCLHIEFDLSPHPEVKYQTGDHLAIWSSNPAGEVERLLRVLGLTAKRKEMLIIKSLDASVAVNIPNPCSLEVLLRHYLWICGPLSKQMLPSLQQFAPSEASAHFISNLYESADEFKTLVRRHINFGMLLELSLQGCTSWDLLPLPWLVENIARLEPRLFSISSSSVVQSRQLSITASIVQTEIEGYTPERGFGLATNYLDAMHHSLIPVEQGGPLVHPYGLDYNLEGHEELKGKSKLFAQVRRSRFKLPVSSKCPILLIAAGSGIAPFRGFIQERAQLKSIGQEIGRVMLFYGCRHAEKDFLYREELDTAAAQLGDDMLIETAFSRQQSGLGGKFYVQDRIASCSRVVTEQLMHPACFVYLCGSPDMALASASRIKEVLCLVQGWESAKAQEFVEAAKRTGRWQEDVWG